MPAGNLKGALVDKYAQIALYDAAENQRVILEAQQAEVRKKAEMKAALDLQIRLQHEATVREKEEDREWVQREQERIVIWNKEEEVKIEATKAKEMNIRKQRAATAWRHCLPAQISAYLNYLSQNWLRLRERGARRWRSTRLTSPWHPQGDQTGAAHTTHYLQPQHTHHLTSLPRRSARETWRNALPTRRTFARWLSRT